MKIVVSNATPLRYFTEIGLEYLFPFLLEKIYLPYAVKNELLHPHTPRHARDLMNDPPDWMEMRSIHPIKHLEPILRPLHAGETEAICLALQLDADLLLLDEKAARMAARFYNITCVGTLGLLEEAAVRGEVDIVESIEKLKKTTFRAHPSLYDLIIRRVRERIEKLQ